MRNGGKYGVVNCTLCGAPAAKPSPRSYSQAYDKQRQADESRWRILKVLLIIGDCLLIGMQPILVYMSKVDGKFLFSPVSVNLLTELCKIIFAVFMLIFQAQKQKPGERSLLSLTVILRAARANLLLAVPSFLYTINNYLKFIMQLYFKPATAKMLGNLKVLTIAVLLKVVMGRKFSTLQWEALCLLLIGISINQMPCGHSDTIVVPISSIAWVCTFFSVTIPSAASVYNEYALKSQFDTSVHLQNLFIFIYGAFFNSLLYVSIQVFQGKDDFNVFKGHSRTTMFLIVNNAMQGILSTFFFKYADTILKKYSSTIATIITGLASAALFGHSLTINFVLGVSVVLISMHQFFSGAIPPGKGHVHSLQHVSSNILHTSSASGGNYSTLGKVDSLLEMTAGAVEEVNHTMQRTSEKESQLPR